MSTRTLDEVWHDIRARSGGCGLWMCAESPQRPPPETDEIWVLTVVIDGQSDPHWDTASSIVATPKKMKEMFNLSHLPHGVRLLKGKAAVRFLSWGEKQEARWQREQKSKNKMSGEN
jgi:hypothetical protein